MRNSFKAKVFSAVLAFLLLFSILTPISAADEINISPEVDKEIRDLIMNEYYLDMDKDFVYGEDIEKVLASLDKYSHYFLPEDYQQFVSGVENIYSGIGVQITAVNGQIEINGILAGGPAEKAGLKAGDIIVSIDGENVKGKTQSYIASKLQGEAGTSVTIEVERKGAGIISFTMKRDIIKMDLEKSQLSQDGIGYFSFPTFATRTGSWFQYETIKLEKEGMKGIILDLRGNPGGRLESALAVSSVILAEDDIIMRTYAKGEETGDYTSATSGYDGPVVLLIDGGSASASEVVAAALKGNQKAIIVGTNTYGKGVAQNAFTLSDGSTLLLTTIEFRGPNGEVIQGTGIAPDYNIEDSDKQLAFAYDYLRKNITYQDIIKFVLALDGSGKATLNGEQVATKAIPFVEKGVSYAPIRFLGENIGYDVAWQSNFVRVWNSGNELVFFPGKSEVLLNGNKVDMGKNLVLRNGVTYAPVRFLAESLGLDVEYSPLENEVVIIKALN